MKKNRRYMVIATTILVLMLAGCSSAKTEEVKEKPVVTVEAQVNEGEMEPEVENTAQEVAEVESTEVVEEPEAVILEGIDLNSIAHGEEWLKSFIGKVNEPVVVVFSDITGRKEVIQQNSKVTINPDEDMIAVYFPVIGMAAKKRGFAVEDGIRGEHYDISSLDSEITRSVGKIPTEITVVGGEEGDVVFNFTIIAE